MKIRRLPVVIVSATIFVAIIWVGGYTFIKNSVAYETAIIFIRENEIIKRHLSDLTSEKLAFFGSSLRSSELGGHAEFKIYVTAKNGNGTVYINLKKNLGVWTASNANLILQNGTIIMLK